MQDVKDENVDFCVGARWSFCMAAAASQEPAACTCSACRRSKAQGVRQHLCRWGVDQGVLHHICFRLNYCCLAEMWSLI